MNLTCPTCSVTTTIPDDRLPPEGARARCQSCGNVSVYYRGGLVADDPTPPQGMDASLTQALPQPGDALHPLAALPSIGLARPLPTEEAAAPPPSAHAGPAKSIGWQIRTARGDEGPLTQDALKPMIRDGRLGPDDLACPPGATEWTRAADLPDLQRWFNLQKKASAAAGKAPAPVADIAPCNRHPGVRGRWLCQGCGDLSCDQCVISAEVMRVQVKQCPACRKACSELVPTKKITPFWEEIPQLLTYPVRGLGWLALIIFPLMGIGVMLSRAAAAAMALAWGAAAFLSLVIYSYHLYVIRVTTQGERSMPNLGKVENWQDELITPAAKAAFVSFLLFMPAGWAANGVQGARMELGAVEGLRSSIVADKEEARKRAEDPNYEPEQATGADAEESVEGALDSAFADMASGEEPSAQEFGNALGSFFGSLDQREDRDFEAELREADAAVSAAKKRVFNRELVRALVVGIALFIWPIFLIIVALFNTIVPVFQPQVLMKLIREIPREYAWCTAITSVCFIAIYLLNLPMRGIMVFENWLTSPATYYFSLIAFHVMGRTAELAEQKVDWH